MLVLKMKNQSFKVSPFHDGVYPKGIDSMTQQSSQKIKLSEGGILPNKEGCANYVQQISAEDQI